MWSFGFRDSVEKRERSEWCTSNVVLPKVLNRFDGVKCWELFLLTFAEKLLMWFVCQRVTTAV